MLLRHQLPLVVNFKEHTNAGEYQYRNIAISMWAFENPTRLTHILAHEMAHHLWNIIGTAAQSFWSKMVSGDLGKLDLREVVKKYKTGWIFDNKEIKRKEPVVYNQLMGLEYGHFGKLSKVTTIEELQEYLDEGGAPVITVNAKPVSGYANKNTNEAFCEAVGQLVAYGPRTVPSEVVSWLKQILPSLKTAFESEVRVARVAGNITAGIIQPPPAMVDEIYRWANAQVAAHQVHNLQYNLKLNIEFAEGAEEQARQSRAKIKKLTDEGRSPLHFSIETEHAEEREKRARQIREQQAYHEKKIAELAKAVL